MKIIVNIHKIKRFNYVKLLNTFLIQHKHYTCCLYIKKNIYVYMHT